MSPKPMPQQDASYLKAQLETLRPAQVKRALQEICALYRAGFRFISENQLAVFETLIVGLLYTRADDPKIRRWGINALALFGREGQCREVLLHVVATHANEPDTVASGVAAIYRMCKNVPATMRSLSLDAQTTTLAALQHVHSSKVDLATLPVKVDTATPEVLRLGLLLVGLNRSVPNLFDPNYSNAEMVKIVGRHDDALVSQYSIWAIAENTDLTLADLGVPLTSVENQRPNVRSWLYRLVALRREDAERHFEYLELGASDPDAEGRNGLALGLKNTYVDGLDSLVLDWLPREQDSDVHALLQEHVVRHSHRSPSYLDWAVDLYKREPEQSLLRQRMEMVVSGTSTFANFMRQRGRAQPDIFGERSNVTNIVNIGNVHGSSLAVGGQAATAGNVVTNYDAKQLTAIHSELSAVERAVHELVPESTERRSALEAVQAARVDPGPVSVGSVLRTIRGLPSLAGIIQNGTVVADALKNLAQYTGLV